MRPKGDRDLYFHFTSLPKFPHFILNLAVLADVVDCCRTCGTCRRRRLLQNFIWRVTSLPIFRLESAMMSQWWTMFIYVMLFAWSWEVVAQAPQPVTNATSNVADLMLMVDCSYYISPSDFSTLLKSVASFVETLPLGPSAVHLAALSYSNVVDRRDFTSDTTLAQNGLLDLFFDGQAALTHAAFDVVYNVMASRRTLRPEARQIVVLITESFARYPAYSRESAERLLEAGVEIWALGIGPYIRQLELLDYTRNLSRTILWDRFDVLPPIPLQFASSITPTAVTSTTDATTATPRIQGSTSSIFTITSENTLTSVSSSTASPTATPTQFMTSSSATKTASAAPTTIVAVSITPGSSTTTSLATTASSRISSASIYNNEADTTPAFPTGLDSTSPEQTTSAEQTTSTDKSPTVRHDFECHLSYMQVFIPVTLVPNSELTLRDPTCKLNNNGTHHKITFAYDECDTTKTSYEDYIDIKNDISVHTILNGTDVITFVEDYKIPLLCSVDRSKMLNSALLVVPRENIAERVQQSSDFTLKEYTSADYSQEITDYPVQVPLNREIFFEITLKNNSNSSIGVYVEQCQATPSPNPNDTTHIALIDLGCPAHPAVNVQPSAEIDHFRFSTQAFRFSAQSSVNSLVYIHCSVSTCGGETCKHSCSSRSRRRRRRSARNLASTILTSGSHVVTNDAK